VGTSTAWHGAGCGSIRDVADDTPAVRISDAERHAADARLRQAVGEGRLTLGEYEERTGQVWAARTAAELVPLTADLPSPQALASVTAWPPVPAPKSRWAVAVLSHTTSGRPDPGELTRAVAVLGNVLIDLRGGPLPPVVEVRATALLGGVDVVVPKGVRVELSGPTILGGSTTAVGPPVVGAPLVRIRVVAVLGGVTVRDEGPEPAVLT
jgi:hypothetical protein